VNGSVGQVIEFRTYSEAIESKTQVSKDDDELNLTSSVPGPQTPLWPLVRFANGMELLCVPVDFTINNADGGMQAMRTQVRFTGYICRHRLKSMKGSSYLGVGSQYTQIARADTGKGSSGPYMHI
jgi:hypothetical protein